MPLLIGEQCLRVGDQKILMLSIINKNLIRSLKHCVMPINITASSSINNAIWFEWGKVRAVVSIGLGRGDGRGRYIERVDGKADDAD